MIKIRITALFILLAFTLSMAACTPADDTPEPVTTTVQTEADEQDAVAQELRLVSTAADITELLDGLLLSESIVAADSYSLGIGNVDPEVCTLDYTNPDVETIISLEPDVVFVSGSSTDGTVDPYSALSDAGVNVVYIPTAESISGIIDNIELIAENTGAEDKAEELTASIDEAVADAKARAESLGGEKVSVYFEISAAPWFYSFGSNTYLDEIISICGGENIYSEETGWISNTEESILAANPQVILTNVMYDGYDYNEIYSREGWEAIDAVVNHRVYSIDANASSRGSQNIVKAIQEISLAIIPDESAQ